MRLDQLAHARGEPRHIGPAQPANLFNARPVIDQTPINQYIHQKWFHGPYLLDSECPRLCTLQKMMERQLREPCRVFIL